MTQIGVRATGYSADDFDWPRQQGVNIIQAEDCWHCSLTSLMAEIHQQIGEKTPTYISFDIDGLDPSVAPGTGTPEPGGLTSIQALEIIRGCYGLNIIGGDLVEVSHPTTTLGIPHYLQLIYYLRCSVVYQAASVANKATYNRFPTLTKKALLL